MADILFSQRHITASDIASTPRLGWVFQEGREFFLYSGSVRIDDGFKRNADGEIVTSYGMVRLFAFLDAGDPNINVNAVPGQFGMQPISMLFQGGHVEVGGFRSSSILFTTTPGSFQQWIDGSVTIVTASAAGALTNFAFWDSANGQVDPYYFYVESATDLFSGNVNAGHTRHYAVFVPHRRSKYLGVGAKVFGVPNTGTWRSQHFLKWMVEKAPVGQTVPSPTYKKARQVEVTVRPDRINMAPNPSGEVDTSGWVGRGTGVMISRSTAVFDGGAASLLTTMGGTWQEDWGLAVSPNIAVTAGETYQFRARLQPTVGTCRVAILWRNSAGTWFATSLGTVASKPNEWTDSLLSAVAPAGAVAGTFFVQASQASMTFYTDKVLIERAKVMGEYFDGSTSADTMWETGGVPGSSRSYLYKNRASRYAAIKRVLDDNVPLGIGIAEPEFGTYPPGW